MNIRPVASGSEVPSHASPNLTQTDPDRVARAKLIASGQVVPAQTEEQPSSGDPQVDKIRRIKMRVQRSTNRHEFQQPTEVNPQEPEQIVDNSLPEMANPDNNEPAQVAEETKPLSPQFAALAKQRRALQVKERELAQREEALKSQAPTETVDWKGNLKANPLSVLQEAGVTYDQLTEAILANQSGQNFDPQALRAQLKEELKKELAEEFTTRDANAENQVLADIDKEAKALVANAGEEYEAIKLSGQTNAVKDLIHRTWKATGEILDVKEAADLVENQLIEEALPFAKAKKVQARLTPAQAAQVVAQTPTPQPKPGTKVMRTLTNRDSVTPGPLSRRERMIKAFQGTLK